MTKSYKAEIAESMSDSKPEYVRICFGPRTMQVGKTMVSGTISRLLEWSDINGTNRNGS
jgi:hypothetical protein